MPVVLGVALLLAACSSADRSASPAQSADGASSCATGGDCQVGDVGPGGGAVFYVAPQTQSWGRYLEAAPAGWNGGEDPEIAWCTTSAARGLVNTRGGIGDGANNTRAIINSCGAESAAGVAAAYRGGGKEDWFLPAQAELQAMYQMRSAVAGMAPTLYWTSSEEGGMQSDHINAWYQRFDTGSTYAERKAYRYAVRPVRAF